MIIIPENLREIAYLGVVALVISVIAITMKVCAS
jgi:hypothetical protein